MIMSMILQVWVSVGASLNSCSTTWLKIPSSTSTCWSSSFNLMSSSITTTSSTRFVMICFPPQIIGRVSLLYSRRICWQIYTKQATILFKESFLIEMLASKFTAIFSRLTSLSSKVRGREILSLNLIVFEFPSKAFHSLISWSWTRVEVELLPKPYCSHLCEECLAYSSDWHFWVKWSYLHQLHITRSFTLICLKSTPIKQS